MQPIDPKTFKALTPKTRGLPVNPLNSVAALAVPTKISQLADSQTAVTQPAAVVNTVTTTVSDQPPRITVGTVTESATPRVVVRSTGTDYALDFQLPGGDVKTTTVYEDPLWIGSLSAGKITGLEIPTVTAEAVGLGNVTNESKATMFTDPVFTGTVTGITADMVGLGNVTNESKATMFSSPTFTGLTTLQQSTEILNTKTGATGVVEHDFSTGAVWYHSAPASNFTADFTNVPTTEDRVITVALILAQGATAYLPTALRINGAAQTIKWIDGIVPPGTASGIDIISINLIRTGSAWVVLAAKSSFL